MAVSGWGGPPPALARTSGPATGTALSETAGPTTLPAAPAASSAAPSGTWIILSAAVRWPPATICRVREEAMASPAAAALAGSPVTGFALGN